jgi:MFS family permease
MIAKPLFGAIADKFHKQKFVFLLFQLVIIVSFAFILVIPTIPSETEFHCHEGEDLLKFCPKSEISDCTYDSIINSNNSFKCDIQCTKNEQFSSICEHWKVPGLCESTDHYVNIHTIIKRNKIIKQEKCYDFLFHNSTINNHNTSLFCPSNKTDAPIFKMNCTVKCDDDEVNEILSASTGNAYQTYQFWTFFILLIISWVGMAVVVSVGDAICFGLLGDKPQRYGHQRLWGSAGWGTLSIISGLLIDNFSQGSTKNYAIGFYLMAGILLLDILVSSKLKYTQASHSSNIFYDIIEILKAIRIHVFLLWCIAVGFGTAMIWQFLFWHLEELQDCNSNNSMKTLQGLVMAIQCFGGEIPFFFMSGKILKRIGHVNAMSLVLFGFGCRFFLYSLLTDPWYVLPIELLNGVTFGLFFSTMASYASIISPPGTESTMQVSRHTMSLELKKYH